MTEKKFQVKLRRDGNAGVVEIKGTNTILSEGERASIDATIFFISTKEWVGLARGGLPFTNRTIIRVRIIGDAVPRSSPTCGGILLLLEIEAIHETPRCPAAT